jgi:ABC-type nitrate/sulfonate/bicarbonate transport system substrate-binding protein
MATVLTGQAVIGCGHGGTVTIVASQSTVTAGGAAVLVEGDLDGATVPDCPTVVTAAGNKPCSSVASVTSGSAAHLSVGGGAALLDTVTGVTDGVPIGNLAITSAGQTVLTAS